MHIDLVFAGFCFFFRKEILSNCARLLLMTANDSMRWLSLKTSNVLWIVGSRSIISNILSSLTSKYRKRETRTNPTIKIRYPDTTDEKTSFNEWMLTKVPGEKCFKLEYFSSKTRVPSVFIAYFIFLLPYFALIRPLTLKCNALSKK